VASYTLGRETVWYRASGESIDLTGRAQSLPAGKGLASVVGIGPVALGAETAIDVFDVAVGAWRVQVVDGVLVAQQERHAQRAADVEVNALAGAVLALAVRQALTRVTEVADAGMVARA
jgi:hypothetical protein